MADDTDGIGSFGVIAAMDCALERRGSMEVCR